MKDPILASILSGLLPGLGQFYCRRWGRGAAFLGGVFLGSVIFPLLGTGVWIWGIVDAYRTAKGPGGVTAGSEGPIIDADRFKLPKMDVRPALPYIFIPLGIAGAIVLVTLIFLVRTGFREKTDAGPQAVIEMIESFKARTGAYPQTLDDLIDPTDPIEKKQILDRWGRPLVYRPVGDGYSLSSMGKDGRDGTEDDVQIR